MALINVDSAPLIPDGALRVSPTEVHNEAAGREIGDAPPAYEDLSGHTLMGVKIEEALRDAIAGRAVEFVRHLLAEGAPLTRCFHGGNPLHWCAYLYANTMYEPVTEGERERRLSKIEIIKEIVAAAERADNISDVLECRDEFDRTPLYLAISNGDLEAMKALVHAGASVENIQSDSGGTALHIIAANEGQHLILQYILDEHNIQNSADDNGWYPIHFATMCGEVNTVKLLLHAFGAEQMRLQNADGNTVWHILATGGMFDEIAPYFLEAGDKYNRWYLNLVNNSGASPINLLASLGLVDQAALLLRHGAALSIKGEKETAIKTIAKTFQNPITFLEKVLDECIYQETNKIYVDYEVLTDGQRMSQINVMEELERCGQSKLLKHPLIESLFYLKWRGLAPVFYVIFATYAMFLCAFNTFVITTFYKVDMNNGSLCTVEQISQGLCVDGCEVHHWISVGLIYLGVSVLLIQECVRLYLQRLRYLRSVESWVMLFGLVLGALVPTLVGCGPASAPAPWQRHVACATLLLTWLQAMLLLARCPGWGYYVLMFHRVAVNILKIFVTTVCLVFGFAMCFMIYFHLKPPFDGPVAAFMKTIAMMASEFEYEDLFEKKEGELNDTIAIVRLLFVMFVIFIAFVLTNFMISVAVGDINQLTNIGDIRRLEQQIKVMDTLDTLRNTFLGKLSTIPSRIRFHSVIYADLQSANKYWTVIHLDEKGNRHDFQLTFSTKLQNNINDLITKKKGTLLDALYEAVVGPPQNQKSTEVWGNSPVTTLVDRIKSVQDLNYEIKQTIENMMNSKDRITSLKQLNEDIDDVQILDSVDKYSAIDSVEVIDDDEKKDCVKIQSGEQMNLCFNGLNSLKDINRSITEMKESIHDLKADFNKILRILTCASPNDRGIVVSTRLRVSRQKRITGKIYRCKKY